MEVLVGIVFVLMYVVIVSEKIHRTIAAMLGATIMMLMGVMTQETARMWLQYTGAAGGHDDSGGGDRAYRIVRLCCY